MRFAPVHRLAENACYVVVWRAFGSPILDCPDAMIACKDIAGKWHAIPSLPPYVEICNLALSPGSSDRVWLVVGDKNGQDYALVVLQLPSGNVLGVQSLGAVGRRLHLIPMDNNALYVVAQTHMQMWVLDDAGFQPVGEPMVLPSGIWWWSIKRSLYPNRFYALNNRWELVTFDLDGRGTTSPVAAPAPYTPLSDYSGTYFAFLSARGLHSLNLVAARNEWQSWAWDRTYGSAIRFTHLEKIAFAAVHTYKNQWRLLRMTAGRCETIANLEHLSALLVHQDILYMGIDAAALRGEHRGRELRLTSSLVAYHPETDQFQAIEFR